jgi:hypothetical protein
MYWAFRCFFANIKSHLASGNVSGASLLWAIATLVVLGGAAAGVSRMNSTAVQEKVAGERGAAAYYAALSGLNYAQSMSELAAGNAFGTTWAMSSLAGDYATELGGKFTLSVVSLGSDQYTVTSQGVAQTGTGGEANAIVSRKITYVPPEEYVPPNLVSFNFNNPTGRANYAAYSSDSSRDIPAALDKADIVPQNLTVGKSYKYGFGNVWYTGTNAKYSTNGIGAFGAGFRLFFTFKFSTKTGDGFTVAVLNASSNNYLSCGGDSAEGGLLGYAGDSRVYDSPDGTFKTKVAEYVDKSGFTKGLNPPKFAVEIDTYSNTSSDWWPSASSASCEGDNGLMNDSSSQGDHVAIMYSGTNAAYLRKTCKGPKNSFVGNVKRYSDVRHGSGDNASNVSGSMLKYMDFKQGRTYFYRMDVVKSGANLTIKSWVATCADSDLNTACTSQVYTAAGLCDTKSDFDGSSMKLNKLTSVYVTDKHTLTTAEDEAFKNFIWGFTSGSGTEEQQIDFRNISLSFR